MAHSAPMIATKQHIRFCKTPDGVKLAYASSGKGPPLVKVANFLNHLEFDWQSPVWRQWLDDLSRDHTFIRYDQRACGLSDWEVSEISFEAWVSDLETVVDALGLERFPLLGMSQGAPIAIAYAARHPERVSHLVLYGGYARGLLRRNPTPQQIEEAQTMVKLGSRQSCVPAILHHAIQPRRDTRAAQLVERTGARVNFAGKCRTLHAHPGPDRRQRPCTTDKLPDTGAARHG